MLRLTVLALTVLLSLGAWACGRKSAPHLPEGEKLKISAEGGLDTLSVYSPYEAELRDEEETGGGLDIGFEEEEEEEDVPDQPSSRPRKDTWRRLDEPEDREKEKRRRPLRDAVERVQEAVETPGDIDRALPDTKQDSSPTDQGGLPPSPGAPTEGGF
jgi:hypothetical protein